MALQSRNVDDLDALRLRIAELRASPKYTEAVPLAEHYARAIGARDGAESLKAAEALVDLAELLANIGQVEQARSLLVRIIEIIRHSVTHDPIAGLQLEPADHPRSTDEAEQLSRCCTGG